MFPGLQQRFHDTTTGSYCLKRPFNDRMEFSGIDTVWVRGNRSVFDDTLIALGSLLTSRSPRNHESCTFANETLSELL